MSQHLIVDFLNRRRIFKPFRPAKLINHKIKKLKASDHKNNVSPEDEEQIIFNDKLKQHGDQNSESTNKEKPTKDGKEHIDIKV